MKILLYAHYAQHCSLLAHSTAILIPLTETQYFSICDPIQGFAQLLNTQYIGTANGLEESTGIRHANAIICKFAITSTNTYIFIGRHSQYPQLIRAKANCYLRSLRKHCNHLTTICWSLGEIRGFLANFPSFLFLLLCWRSNSKNWIRKVMSHKRIWSNSAVNDLKVEYYWNSQEF